MPGKIKMRENANILVFRFSAMGDVAMSAAVIREFCVQYPDVHVVVVSRALFRPFFAAIPKVIFHSIHPETAHRGVLGLYRLFRELVTYDSNAIADLHYSLRSRILTLFFGVKRIQIE